MTTDKAPPGVGFNFGSRVQIRELPKTLQNPLPENCTVDDLKKRVEADKAPREWLWIGTYVDRQNQKHPIIEGPDFGENKVRLVEHSAYLEMRERAEMADEVNSLHVEELNCRAEVIEKLTAELSAVKAENVGLLQLVDGQAAELERVKAANEGLKLRVHSGTVSVLSNERKELTAELSAVKAERDEAIAQAEIWEARNKDLQARIEQFTGEMNCGISHELFDMVCCERDTLRAKAAKLAGALERIAGHEKDSNSLADAMNKFAREALGEWGGKEGEKK